MTENNYEESIYNLNDNASGMGGDAMSYQGGMGQPPQEESI